MNQSEMDRLTAYHEAGHAAADLILEHGVTVVSIRPAANKLGASSPLEHDVFSKDGISNLVISLYAGAEAERLAAPRSKEKDYEISLGAHSDDEAAEEYLHHLSKSSDELRHIAADLVAEHWGLVTMIANELIEHIVLDGEELDFLYAIYQGNAHPKDLEQFRILAESSLKNLPGRK